MGQLGRRDDSFAGRRSQCGSHSVRGLYLYAAAYPVDDSRGPSPPPISTWRFLRNGRRATTKTMPTPFRRPLAPRSGRTSARIPVSTLIEPVLTSNKRPRCRAPTKFPPSLRRTPSYVATYTDYKSKKKTSRDFPRLYLLFSLCPPRMFSGRAEMRFKT